MAETLDARASSGLTDVTNTNKTKMEKSSGKEKKRLLLTETAQIGKVFHGLTLAALADTMDGRSKESTILKPTAVIGKYIK